MQALKCILLAHIQFSVMAQHYKEKPIICTSSFSMYEPLEVKFYIRVLYKNV